jgi:hypothetical protein
MDHSPCLWQMKSNLNCRWNVSLLLVPAQIITSVVETGLLIHALFRKAGEISGGTLAMKEECMPVVALTQRSTILSQKGLATAGVHLPRVDKLAAAFGQRMSKQKPFAKLREHASVPSKNCTMVALQVLVASMTISISGPPTKLLRHLSSLIRNTGQYVVDRAQATVGKTVRLSLLSELKTWTSMLFAAVSILLPDQAGKVVE